MSLYASGRDTGLVYDSGEDFSRIVQVYKGYG
jgi:actin-related protein